MSTSNSAFYGAVATAGISVLMENTEIRRVFRAVLHDPKVQNACLEAGEKVYREIAASLRRHDGMTIFAGFLRH